MKKIVLTLAAILFLIYCGICAVLYFYQESIIFQPSKLPKDYAFVFGQSFEETNIRMNDGVLLNGLLFKTDSSKGLVFYLHGNAGSLSTWGFVASTYNAMGYDVFIWDYRGYGKSDGKIKSEKQFFEDNQTVYGTLAKNYAEKNIIVIGYSLGTGLASKLAADNHPKLLILQAPYYSFTDVMKHKVPGISTMILKYHFKTNEDLKKCSMPVVIFHGTADEVIPYSSSLKLKQELGSKITLYTLDGVGHNYITEDGKYLTEMLKLLK